jgi:hypothetical protein
MKTLTGIYFYNAMGLAKELRDKTISQTRAVKHMIMSIILGGIGFQIPISVTFEKRTEYIVFHLFSVTSVFIIIAVISYYGVWLTHQVNGKGDGQDYFVRFAALSLPIGMQLVLLFLAIGLLIVLLAMFLVTQLGAIATYIIVVIFSLARIAFTAMFFLRMRNYIAVASGYSE